MTDSTVADSTKSPMIHPMGLELVHFKTDPAKESAMLASRPAAVAAIRSACPGLLNARMFRGEQNGEWIDIWFWESMKHAKSAAEVAGNLPEAQTFFAFITEPPVMVHGTMADEYVRTEHDEPDARRA
jgi:hypothetical protein